jgi:glutamyl-tRNA synthetase
MSVRVRFAPSPTGFLHIGGARTALFNWLFARHNDGEFVIRVEDTDLARSTTESMDSILEALDWLGLDHDGEILSQSSRKDEHVKLAKKLLDEGKAYKCYATPEELEEMKEKAVAEGRQPKYDRRWRDGGEPPSPDAPYAIRFKMPMTGSTTIEDAVLGTVTVNHGELDDLIIVRRDGTPTYNFVVVCDDAFMEISHVIRGQDHMTNTFRQAQIYEALGYERPTFAHLPLVDGLSKRKGSLSVQHYRDEGFLKEAVINYMARLGWSHGDREIFSISDLVELFDLRDVNRSSATYDESKMLWVNTEWLRLIDSDELGQRLASYLKEQGIDAEGDDRLGAIADLYRERAETLVEMAEKVTYFFEAPEEYNAKHMKKWLKADSKDGFVALIDKFRALDDFDTEHVDGAMRETLKEHDLKYVKLAQPCRIALSGAAATPSIDATIATVGKEESIRRMEKLVPHFPEPQS